MIRKFKFELGNKVLAKSNKMRPKLQVPVRHYSLAGTDKTGLGRFL